MERYLKKTIRTYDHIATDYLRATRDRQPEEEFHAFHQQVVTGKVILDAGCGGGRDCRAFAERGFQVIGIDLSVEMLKIARDLAPECEFRQADLREIPLEDATVDGIWCCASLLHLKREHVRHALLEFKRVLKEKAVCGIFVKRGTGEKFVIDSLSQGKPRFYSYFQPDEMHEYCQSLGFDILFEEMTGSHTNTHNENWIYLLIRKP